MNRPAYIASNYKGFTVYIFPAEELTGKWHGEVTIKGRLFTRNADTEEEVYKLITKLIDNEIMLSELMI